MKIRSGRQKIKAFTLNEMIVVLLITVIVVGMAFSTLSLVQRQMGNIEGIYKVKTEANKLRQSLWMDFNRFSKVIYDSRTETLYFSNGMERQQYQITKELLIRETDTFDIKLKSKDLYFNNSEIVSGEIDALELQTSKETGSQYIFVYKDNASATYMNQ